MYDLGVAICNRVGMVTRLVRSLNGAVCRYREVALAEVGRPKQPLGMSG